MLVEMQILGLFFGLVMLYLTFLYYKRKDYGFHSFLIWLLIWIFFLIMVIYPIIIYNLMDILKIERTVDFFIIAGAMLFAIIVFYLFVKVKKIEEKIKKLVMEWNEKES